MLSVIICAVLVTIILASCAAGPNTARMVPNEKGNVAGFWRGVWHGLIAPVTFIISLFKNNVTMYEVRNSGHGYDFGFVLGAGIFFSTFGYDFCLFKF
ncbi:MAG: hypothetical protein M1365_10095 [Actinobacteria bacterium]|nr:hypothetical protein [Actinomycetota bacterium]